MEEVLDPEEEGEDELITLSHLKLRTNCAATYDRLSTALPGCAPRRPHYDPPLSHVRHGTSIHTMCYDSKTILTTLVPYLIRQTKAVFLKLEPSQARRLRALFRADVSHPEDLLSGPTPSSASLSSTRSRLPWFRGSYAVNLGVQFGNLEAVASLEVLSVHNLPRKSATRSSHRSGECSLDPYARSSNCQEADDIYQFSGVVQALDELCVFRPVLSLSVGGAPLDALTQAVARLWMRFSQYPVLTVLRKVLQCRHDAGTCVRLGGVYDFPECRYQMYATVFWASVQEPQMARESAPSAVVPTIAVGPSPQISVRMSASTSSSPFFFSESLPSLPATPDFVLSTLLPAFEQNLPEFEQGSSSLKRGLVEEEDDTAVHPPFSRRRVEAEGADLEWHTGFDVPMPDHVADDLASLLATVSQREASPKFVLRFVRDFISPTLPLTITMKHDLKCVSPL
ncbi:hypothetical protein NLJ89_g4843 [Agrocybe chaxingu]|uniref:Uncharacterized protein n=1 Tax=Agrocybe chaxingu TaxID=84603 RepID=A0A9W8MU65_9AGAR|nr:hypothetical protein NLJ89_g4843 [Agrocybe chaxingu]